MNQQDDWTDEVADVQGMYLDISSYDILGLNRSI
jgi:hypothetical protein